MKKIFCNIFIICIMAALVLCTACHSRSNNEEEIAEEEAVEYPVAIIPDHIATDLEDATTLYPVSEEFLRNFLSMCSQFDGTHSTIRSEFPTEWGVRCIERLPEGKELWHLQSANREWAYLVVTSGSGTQRILDLLPVATNVAVQSQNELETEIWHTLREPDGSFLVYKSYEWTRSLDGATRSQVMDNPDNYSRTRSVTDRYVLNEMGRFEFIEPQDTVEYQAVFFYYDRKNKPEEWDDVMEIVQSYCEEKGIYFDEVYNHLDNVYIRDYKENDIIPMNLMPYLNLDEEPAGMVMMKNGFEPKTVPFGSTDQMKAALIRYFKIGKTQVS